jgi:AraC family transcriptional regulator, chemosensory pili system protein ChpD
MIFLRTPLLELAGIQASAAGFPKHTHDEYVISVNLGGLEEVWLDGSRFEVRPDMLTVYAPGAVQASRSLSGEDWQCLSLYVAPAAFPAYFDCLPPDLPSQLQRPELAAALRQLAGQEASLRTEAIIALLARLPQQGPSAANNTSHRGSLLVRRVQQQLLDDLSQPLTLDTLAQQAGITPAHLVRSFHQACGLPPLAWQMQQRMAEARRQLRAGKAIVDVALATGFADQAHFSKAFSRFCGMTPGRYRQINF